MIIQKSPEILEKEQEIEEKRIKRVFDDKDKQREFELEKVRLESSIPKRHQSIQTLLLLPVFFTIVLCAAILVLFRREIPEIFYKMI
jgi:hypothetical protein